MFSISESDNRISFFSPFLLQKLRTLTLFYLGTAPRRSRRARSPGETCWRGIQKKKREEFPSVETHKEKWGRSQVLEKERRERAIKSTMLWRIAGRFQKETLISRLTYFNELFLSRHFDEIAYPKKPDVIQPVRLARNKRALLCCTRSANETRYMNDVFFHFDDGGIVLNTHSL